MKRVIILIILLSCVAHLSANEYSQTERALIILDTVNNSLDNQILRQTYNNDKLSASGSGWNYIINEFGHLSVTFKSYKTKTVITDEDIAITGNMIQTQSGIVYDLSISGEFKISTLYVEIQPDLEPIIFKINGVDFLEAFKDYSASGQSLY